MSITHDLDTSLFKDGEQVNLEELIARHGFKPELVMVRLDGEIVKKADLSSTAVGRGQEVKVYQLVGGG